MSLRYALLSLLTGQPKTGYEIGKAFESSVGHVWHAADSQIYPELRRMEADGLLDCTEQAKGRTTRKVYAVSAAGERALRDWLSAPDRPVRSRDPQYLRAAYLEWADPAAARAQLEEYVRHYTEQRDLLRRTRDSLLDRSHPVLAARLARLPAEQHEAVVAFKAFAYAGMIRQAEEQVAWAREGLTLIDELERSGVYATAD
ncbi:PadR family transcriptional regulator [Enemella evansiae]|uniref:PadR family transcriptional regulator n=1 Tax=Enemella evansiae TaxID=2016499 RepID=UPI00105BEF4F|nr:PadR family transcriptional regulator [Enemella evansiae]TDO91412.1 PadR family transcriptional regulator [Enemella evansiae]